MIYLHSTYLSGVARQASISFLTVPFGGAKDPPVPVLPLEITVSGTTYNVSAMFGVTLAVGGLSIASYLAAISAQAKPAVSDGSALIANPAAALAYVSAATASSILGAVAAATVQIKPAAASSGASIINAAAIAAMQPAISAAGGSNFSSAISLAIINAALQASGSNAIAAALSLGIAAQQNSLAVLSLLAASSLSFTVAKADSAESIVNGIIVLPAMAGASAQADQDAGETIEFTAALSGSSLGILAAIEAAATLGATMALDSAAFDSQARKVLLNGEFRREVILTGQTGYTRDLEGTLQLTVRLAGNLREK